MAQGGLEINLKFNATNYQKSKKKHIDNIIKTKINILHQLFDLWSFLFHLIPYSECSGAQPNYKSTCITRPSIFKINFEGGKTYNIHKKLRYDFFPYVKLYRIHLFNQTFIFFKICQKATSFNIGKLHRQKHISCVDEKKLHYVCNKNSSHMNSNNFQGSHIQSKDA